MNRFWRTRFLKGALMVVALLAVLSWVVMTLWNLLLPSLLAAPAISYLQAAGLLVLSRLLFGGWRGPGFGPSRFGSGRFGGDRHGRQYMDERWEQMTPEEREKLRAGLRHRCGPWRSRG